MYMTANRANSRFLWGFVLFLLGITGLSIATGLYFNFDRFMACGSCLIILWPFCLLFFGGVFGLLGGYLLYQDLRNAHRVWRLKSHGICINATIIGFIADWKVQANNQATYKILLSYRDSAGNAFQFRSHNLIQEPDNSIINQTCQVYLNPEVIFEDFYGVFEDKNKNFSHYYVDIDAFLERTCDTNASKAV